MQQLCSTNMTAKLDQYSMLTEDLGTYFNRGLGKIMYGFSLTYFDTVTGQEGNISITAFWSSSALKKMPIFWCDIIIGHFDRDISYKYQPTSPKNNVKQKYIAFYQTVGRGGMIYKIYSNKKLTQTPKNYPSLFFVSRILCEGFLNSIFIIKKLIHKINI